jgi:rhodanese-related sulfurtransferase
VKHSAGFLRVVEDAKTRIKEVTIADVRARFARGERFELIDVREDREWNDGHIPRAKHVGRGVLERDVEGLYPDPETDLVLYCGGGFRSALAADMLQKMGYRRVTSMDGGWRGWKETGGEIEKP